MIDYRSLLVRYMAGIANVDDCTHIGYTFEPTVEEKAELVNLAKEATQTLVDHVRKRLRDRLRKETNDNKFELS
jgi:hypothetical protein